MSRAGTPNPNLPVKVPTKRAGPPNDNLPIKVPTKRAAQAPSSGRPVGRPRKTLNNSTVRSHHAKPRPVEVPKIQTPARNNRYQLPSFEKLEVGTALEPFDDGADDSWEDFDGNVDHWHGMMAGSTAHAARAEGKPM